MRPDGVLEYNRLHSRQTLKIFKLIQHPYNVSIIEPQYYKAYLAYISVQKAIALPVCVLSEVANLLF